MHKLSSTRVLWVLLISVLLVAAAFITMEIQVGGTVLDKVFLQEDVHALLATMNDAQKMQHYRLTLWLDSVFPVLYSLLLVGAMLRWGGSWSASLAKLTLLIIPFDWSENVIQLMALTGDYSYLAAKVWLTPAKYIVLLIALMYVIWALMRTFLFKK